jgi:hypothetical protein
LDISCSQGEDGPHPAQQVRADLQQVSRLPVPSNSDLQRGFASWADTIRSFVNAIDGTSPKIMNENASDIGVLCDEFGQE